MPLLPENQLQNSPLVYLQTIKIRTQIIYSATVSVLLLTIGSLPLISTPIYFKANGAFQTSIEKITLVAPTNGYVSSINLQDNQKVTKGTILLTLDATITKKEEQELLEKQKNLDSWVLDIKAILQDWETPNLNSKLYQARNQEFKQSVKSDQLAVIQAQRNYDRYSVLLQKKVISNAEFELFEIQYSQATSRLQSAIASYKFHLQQDAKTYLNELSNLKMLNYSTALQYKNYQLKAMEDGFIQNSVGIAVGAFVFANQKLGEISPNGKLFAYCYVNSKDIGMIREKQQVNFQIDAFDYNQWGTAIGTVMDIAEDVTLLNGLSFFKVKCHLASSFLQLKNGIRCKIKKGMNFTARFQVAHRTLWQLLTDKTTDWLSTN